MNLVKVPTPHPRALYHCGRPRSNDAFPPEHDSIGTCAPQPRGLHRFHKQ